MVLSKGSDHRDSYVQKCFNIQYCIDRMLMNQEQWPELGLALIFHTKNFNLGMEMAM